MYIGRPQRTGPYITLDDISSQFNGVDVSFNLTSGGSPFIPDNPYTVSISLNGVIQEPVTSYTLVNDVITFANPPSSNANFFALVIGLTSDRVITNATSLASGVDVTAGDITCDNLSIAGIITANKFFGDGTHISGVTGGVGVQSGGNMIGAAFTAINFIGAGNTFAVRGNVIDVSVEGSSEIIGINTTGTSTFNHINASGIITAPTFDGNLTGDVTGNVTGNLTGNVVGSGVNINNLNATNLAFGIVPDARFPAVLPAASAANLNNIPSVNLTGALPGIDGGNLTNLSAGNLTGALPAIDGSALTGIGVGINSAGTSIATNVNTLNFVGAGNTFAYNSSTSTVDISISGGSGGGGGGSAASAGSAINYPGGSVSPFVLSSVHITEDITLDNNNADSVPANVITGESTVTVDDGVTITIDEGKTVIPDLYNVLSDAYTAPA